MRGYSSARIRARCCHDDEEGLAESRCHSYMQYQHSRAKKKKLGNISEKSGRSVSRCDEWTLPGRLAVGCGATARSSRPHLFQTHPHGLFSRFTATVSNRKYVYYRAIDQLCRPGSFRRQSQSLHRHRLDIVQISRFSLGSSHRTVFSNWADPLLT